MTNKKRFLAVVALVIVAVLCIVALVACQDKPGDEHACESKCPTCGKCTNKDCKEDACKDKCPGHTPDYDMSGVTFADKTVTYNGKAQKLEVSGSLPTGVTVAYEYYAKNGETETKIEGEPVNAGTYKVVAKFTGDSEHKAIEDKIATLTISKADLEVVLGATQYVEDRQYKDLETEVTFAKAQDGNFTHEYDGKEYAIEIMSSNVDLEDLTWDFYMDKEMEVTTGDTIKNVGVTVYVLVTLDSDAEYFANFNKTSVLVSITIEKRTVEISSAEDLELLRSEMSSVDADIRYNTRYVLTSDIDLDGAVWKTIGAKNEGDSFIGEFDGNGKTISNFVINETSIDKDDITNVNGISFGFWGFLKDAYIHSVTFDSFEAKVDVKQLEIINPEFVNSGSAANPICFGILAGRTRFGSEIGTHFEDVTVTNADILFKTYGGFYGTFIGEEYAGAGGLDDKADKNNGEDSDEGARIIRKNLDASNVKIQAVELACNPFGRLSVGGLVGELMFDTHYYEDCDVSDIVLINGDETVHGQVYHGRDGSPRYGWYTANVGGLIGLDYSTWQESKFTNCTVSNYRIVTFVNSESASLGVFYCGTMRGINGGDAFGSGVALVDCTATNGDDSEKAENEKYGMFKYFFDGSQWNKYEFDQVIDGTETELWVKYVGDATELKDWVEQDGRYAINDDTGLWEKYVYDSGSESWRKEND